MGNKAAIGDQGDRLNILEEDCENMAELVQVRWKGRFLDLVVEVMQPHVLILNEEEYIKRIVDKTSVNETGHLFELGYLVANNLF